MDYSYYGSPAQPYNFFPVSTKTGHSYTPQDEPQNDPLEAYNDPNAFQLFDQNTPFNTTPINPSSPHPRQRPSVANALLYDSSGSMSNDINADGELDQAQGRSSDDDKDYMTPAQSRRKAQNRAAQRAFRERKERHVKDLELKLKSMEAHSTELLSDNERLKRELDRVATQNEILRATSTPTILSNRSHNTQRDPTPSDQEALGQDPMVYSPTTFKAAFNAQYPDQPISHRLAVSTATGERLMAAGATWDLIHNHELYRKGMVDLGTVLEKLEDRAQCDGTGPTFAEGEVRRVIEESVGVAGDELI